MSFIRYLSQPPYPLASDQISLRRILPQGADRSIWETALRPQLLQDWRARLGHASGAAKHSPEDFQSDPGNRYQGEGFRAEVWRSQNGYGQEQTIIVLQPEGTGRAADAQARLPAALVPFYFAERSSGFVVGSAARGQSLTVDETLAATVPLGLHLVRLGLVVVCVEAFPFNTVPRPDGMEHDAFAWWRSGAKKLLEAHPQWTGLGRLVHDTRRALDLLCGLPNIDPRRILIMGHSLGGKMAFFTAAMDPRITAVIASDFGLPWRSTNWHEPWYLGERVPADDAGAALHEILALIAPRPFLLIAGETDGPGSWPYLEAARPIYALYEAGEHLGCIDHASGHRPPITALDTAYAWLGEHFGLERRPWLAAPASK